jgi:pyruvate-formate lyase-activating enzyme
MHSIITLYNSLKKLRDRTIGIQESLSRFAGITYRCGALSGETPYCITIGPDMQLSCNDHDYDYACTLGNLRQNRLNDILHGSFVRSINQDLASGRIPFKKCISCGYLRRERKTKGNQAEIPPINAISTLRVEATRRCNLRCLNCANTRMTHEQKKGALSLSDIEILADALNTNGIHSVVYSGFGEPFFSDDIYYQLSRLRSLTESIKISCSTNAVLLNTDLKREAALLLDHLYVSIFGPGNDVYRIYHKNGTFDDAYENLVKLTSFREQRHARLPIIEWKYVLFWWNDRRSQIGKVLDLARSGNVDLLSLHAGGKPFFFASWRYRFDPFFRTVGVPVPFGRLFDFHGVLEDPGLVDDLRSLTPGSK